MNHLTVLGCRAGSPGGASPASGYVLTVGARNVLIDCGPGVVAAAATRGVLASIDAVVISHRHADHCADLVALGYARRFPSVSRPLPLAAPTGFGEVLAQLDAVWGIPTLPDLAAPLSDAFDLCEVAPGEGLTLAGLELATHATHHPVPTMALRCEEADLAYTADAAATRGLAEFCHGMGTLVAESTYRRAEGAGIGDHGHMTGRDAGQLGTDAKTGALVLTHFADLTDAPGCVADARRRYAGPVTAAYPGMVIPLAGRCASSGIRPLQSL